MNKENTRHNGNDDINLGLKENFLRKFSLMHPVFFASFPVLAFLSQNIQQIPFSQANRSLVFSILGALLLILLFRVVFRDWYKGAALASIILILFFSYGHVYMMLKETRIAGILIGRHRFLLPLFVLLFLIGSWYVAKRIRNVVSLSKILVLVSLVSLISPVYTLIMYKAQFFTKGDANSFEMVPLEDEAFSELKNKPDIYYIILDAYIRSDILREDFGYDNSYFLQQLRERGFYVADQATSNYSLTALSLTSSLNMKHLIDEFGAMKADDYPIAMIDSIAHSKVRNILEQYGYTMVALASSWQPTEIEDADIYFRPQISELDRYREAGRINAFESIFIRTTAFLGLIDLSVRDGNPILKNLEAPYLAHHYWVLSQFEYLEQVPTLPGPKFVFAHIISPHHPYVFGPNGEILTSTEAFTWADGTGPRESVETEMALYRDQTQYISSRTLEVIETILSRSERQPIIFLQADHGPGIRMYWNSPSNEALIERMSILSAFLLPESCTDALYPSITPVNSFAIMFQCAFGQRIELKEDLNFFSPRGDPYQFTDVTNLVH